MTVITADCLMGLKMLASDSVDSIVTDPPYGLSFMGKKWDYDVPSVEIWAECLRVLKPGGHLLAFAGTRTQHRMAVRIEDAGFEIRDMIAWVYGSGFPKSLDVSKAIDKAAGAERKVTRAAKVADAYRPAHIDMDPRSSADRERRDAPATDAARQWQGWGTALKPALEPITVARKPLVGTVAENVLQHGTGAINVEGCRVDFANDRDKASATPQGKVMRNNFAPGEGRAGIESRRPDNDAGRWPANLIHDGSEEPVRLLGEAARFFYCAKASKKDRDEGLEGFEAQQREAKYGSIQDARPHTPEGYEYHREPRRNTHPTVKPTDLMRYLCRLVTPPGGLVLDPFTGSGSTGKAATLEGFRFIGFEVSEEYAALARARMETAK